MTLEDLGNIGEFIGAIAVVLSLVYLAVQIRQNTNAVRSGTHQATLDAAQRINNALMQYPEFASLLVKANTDYESLTRDERVRFAAFADQYFETWQTSFLNHTRTLIDFDTWRAMDISYVRQLSPALLHFWEKERDRYVRAFQEHVDSSIRS